MSTSCPIHRRGKNFATASEELYYEIFKASPAAIAIFTREDLRLRQVNDGFELFFEQFEPDSIGRTADDLRIEFAPASWDAILTELESRRLIKRRRMHVSIQGGKPRGVLATIISISLRNSECGYIVVKLVDLTATDQLDYELLDAVERERMELGMEIHDGLASILTAAVGNLEAIARRVPSPVASLLATTAKQIVEAGEEARRIAHRMIPRAIDSGLKNGVEDHIALVATSFAVRISLQWSDATPDTDDSTNLQLFRIVQESVANCIRHGGATRIEVVVAPIETNGLLLQVRDDGEAAGRQEIKGAGVGLSNIRRRANLIGGHLAIDTTSHGTTVTCRIPSLRSHLRNN